MPIDLDHDADLAKERADRASHPGNVVSMPK
jgi:hypothetical protein